MNVFQQVSMMRTLHTIICFGNRLDTLLVAKLVVVVYILDDNVMHLVCVLITLGVANP